MNLLENIYTQLTQINPISTEEFSQDYLGKSTSYYRVLKHQNSEPTNFVLEHLGYCLHQQAIVHSSSKHPFLMKQAKRFDELAHQVTAELASRQIKAQEKQSKWIRNTIRKTVEKMNDERLNPQSNIYGTPPIVFGF